MRDHDALSTALEANDPFGHESLELPAVLDVARRVSDVLLIHIFSLRDHVCRDEPATTELPAIRADIADDARHLPRRLVVANAGEELLVRQEPVDRVHRVLMPGAFRDLG